MVVRRYSYRLEIDPIEICDSDDAEERLEVMYTVDVTVHARQTTYFEDIIKKPGKMAVLYLGYFLVFGIW